MWIGSASRKLAQIASKSDAFCANSLAARVPRTRAECGIHGRGPPATVHSGCVDANDLEGLGLVDHHVHGVSRADEGRARWEAMLTESHRLQPTPFDSQVGLSIRRWCAPILGLPEFASPETYYARRAELGIHEVNRRFLAASGIQTYLLDTGFLGDALLGPDEMRSVSGRRVEQVVRIEAVMDAVAARGVEPHDFPDVFRGALSQASEHAVGLKSIVAYRHGFGFDPRPPSDADVVHAARGYLACPEPRVTDPVLLRFGLWCAVERGLPLQIHAGFGDPDLDLRLADPLLLTAWLRAIESSGIDVILLHCYPFHRNAGYLAHVFGHVHFDVSLAGTYTGLRSDAVLAESLELAPFSKVLFATDGCGPAELHYLGARLWRTGMARVLSAWIDAGELSPTDGLRIARMIGRDNARRLYHLD